MPHTPTVEERVPVLAPGEVQVDGVQTLDEAADEAWSLELERRAQSVEKRVVDRRKALLIRRLKRRRGSKYTKPREGGEGKQSRTRRRRFS